MIVVSEKIVDFGERHEFGECDGFGRWGQLGDVVDLEEVDSSR